MCKVMTWFKGGDLQQLRHLGRITQLTQVTRLLDVLVAGPAPKFALKIGRRLPIKEEVE